MVIFKIATMLAIVIYKRFLKRKIVFGIFIKLFISNITYFFLIIIINIIKILVLLFFI